VDEWFELVSSHWNLDAAALGYGRNLGMPSRRPLHQACEKNAVDKTVTSQHTDRREDLLREAVRHVRTWKFMTNRFTTWKFPDEPVKSTICRKQLT
jgi:hypothetical protein